MADSTRTASGIQFHHGFIGADLATDSGPLPTVSIGASSSGSEAESTVRVPVSLEGKAASIVHLSYAVVGERTRHTYAIEDDDRGLLVSVTDQGATPDDATDDTAAVQAAIDDVYARGGRSTGKGGVIVFSPGRHIVSSVKGVQVVYVWLKDARERS